MSRMHDSVPPPCVFIIEDDPAIRDALSLVASDRGYRVEAFETGGSFLRGNQPTPADIVLLDISLPGLDGVAVARAMESRGDRCNIAVISGLREAAFNRAVHSINPVKAFRKPLEINEILDFLPPCEA